jgi:hypothetical protein
MIKIMSMPKTKARLSLFQFIGYISILILKVFAGHSTPFQNLTSLKPYGKSNSLSTGLSLAIFWIFAKNRR